MITKDSRTIATKRLRQDKTLRDHGATDDAGYTLNRKFPDLIPFRFSSGGPVLRTPGAQPGEPGAHGPPVLPVLGAERADEPGLLVPAHGGRRDAPGDQRVLQEPGR